jgi:polysaccharide biosynthesis protein PelC
MAMTRTTIPILMLIWLTACSGSSSHVFRDANMDFGVVQNVAVMPFANQTREQTAADRVRDVFVNKMLFTGGVYVTPLGEVKRGIMRAGISDPTAPSPEEVTKFVGIVKVDAVITGTVKEYGEVRSGTAVSNVISISMQMLEAQTGRIVWSAASTKGGVTIGDRLFGGGGEPMNVVTEKAVDDIINKLFK